MKKERYTYYFFLAAGILLYLYSLWERVPDIDGAWIGENAYWLAKVGYAKSELMRGITSQETLTIIHHKLFNLTGALIIKVFSFSVSNLKAISLFFFSVLMFLSYQYTVKSRQLFSKKEWILFFILMLYFPWMFKYSFVYRPEVMITTLGFASFILLEQSIITKNKRAYSVWFAGLLMGLAIATHLNGIVLATSGFFLLVLNKKYKMALPYSVGALMGLSIYFYDFYQPGYFDFWYYQFFNSPTVKEMHEYPVWLEPIINLLSEHMRYFHNFKIIVFSAFILFTLIIGFKHLYRNHKVLTQFALLMFLFTGMLTIHDTRKYILLNLPYIFILVVITMKALRDGRISQTFKLKARTAYLISFSLMLIFLMVSFGFNLNYSMKKFSSEQNRALSLKYAGENTSSMNIVTPLTFIFNEIEYYNQIQGEVCYTEFQKAEPNLKGLKFLEKAESFGNELLIITPYYQNKLGINNFEKGKQYGNFLVVEKNDDYIILKKPHRANDQ
jgi:hypothetical protein